MQEQKSKNEKVSFGDGINEFIQRNRKIIFIITGIIIILFIGSLIFVSVKERADIKSAERIEELNRRFDELKPGLNDEFFTEDVNSFLAELETFASKARGYSGSKAWLLAGDIYYTREDWSLAEQAFLNAANIGKKTYLGPIAYSNAAAAAEESGNPELAIEYLILSLALNIEFPGAPRAQFSIGRLNEQTGNIPAAIEAYREVLIKWSDSAWHQLAYSRIISLEIEN